MAHALTGKVALVTGADKGIGAGIAKAMSSAGASVVVNFASDRPGAERVVADIEAAGGSGFAIQANVFRIGVAHVGRVLSDPAPPAGPIGPALGATANFGVYSCAQGSRPFDAWLREAILAGVEIDGPDEPLQERVADETVDAHAAEALIAGRTHDHQRPVLHERAQPLRRW